MSYSGSNTNSTTNVGGECQLIASDDVGMSITIVICGNYISIIDITAVCYG